VSRVIFAALLVPALAHAQPADTTTPTQEIGDQAIGVEAGLAAGGRDTPGGFRIAGHYLYQLADTDWFDGTASFTFGGDTAACFRDRMNNEICDHGLMQGQAAEVSANVRRFFDAQGDFRPFVRGGVGIGVAHYGADSVTGLIIPLHVGSGVRAAVADNVAVTAIADFALGFGAFNKSLGLEPEIGLSIVAGAEFRL